MESFSTQSDLIADELRRLKPDGLKESSAPVHQVQDLTASDVFDALMAEDLSESEENPFDGGETLNFFPEQSEDKEVHRDVHGFKEGLPHRPQRGRSGTDRYKTGSLPRQEDVYQELHDWLETTNHPEATLTFCDVVEDLVPDKTQAQQIDYSVVRARACQYLRRMGQKMLRLSVSAQSVPAQTMVFSRYLEDVCFGLAEALKKLDVGMYQPQDPAHRRKANLDQTIDSIFYHLWKHRVEREGIPAEVIAYWEEQYKVDPDMGVSGIEQLEAWGRKDDDRSVLQRSLHRVLTRLIVETYLRQIPKKTYPTEAIRFVTADAHFGEVPQNALLDNSLKRTPAVVGRHAVMAFLPEDVLLRSPKVVSLLEEALPSGMDSRHLASPVAFLSGLLSREIQSGNTKATLGELMQKYSFQSLAGSPEYGSIQSVGMMPAAPDLSSMTFRRQLSMKSLVWGQFDLECADADYLRVVVRDALLSSDSPQAFFQALLPGVNSEDLLRSPDGRHRLEQLHRRFREAAKLVTDCDQRALLIGCAQVFERSSLETMDQQQVTVEDTLHQGEKRSFSLFRALQVLAHNVEYSNQKVHEVMMTREYDKQWDVLKKPACSLGARDLQRIDWWFSAQRDLRTRVIQDAMIYFGYRPEYASSLSQRKAGSMSRKKQGSLEERGAEWLLANLEHLGGKQLTLLLHDQEKGTRLVRWSELPIRQNGLGVDQSPAIKKAYPGIRREDLQDRPTDFLRSLQGTFFSSSELAKNIVATLSSVKLRRVPGQNAVLSPAKSYTFDDRVLGRLV